MTKLKSNSNLEKILAKGEFAVTTEFEPTKNANIDFIRKNANHLKGYVDAVNVPDNKSAVVKVSSLAGCVILMQEGLEPILHINVRDRNRIALQSDVLGASVLGIRNILCLSGEHQTKGNHPTAKNVYDIDSIQLIQTIKKMRDEKKFMNNEEIENPPQIFIGATSGPFIEPLGIRIPRLAKKISAGGDFIQTQEIFDIQKFSTWMEKFRKSGLHEKTNILASVIYVKSVEDAQYLQKNVSGIDVPEEIIKRLKDAQDQAGEGIKIAQDIIKGLREIDGIAGVHVMAIRWEKKVKEIVEGAGLLPRAEV